jgi:hypothetical protein
MKNSFYNIFIYIYLIISKKKIKLIYLFTTGKLSALQTPLFL